jgi:hypothetical protein
MMRPEARWFIDAWSVLDGYAFASLRPPASLDADATFFLAPPYFEPEPVATLATALAATRGHFQEGFRDQDGEVPFRTIDHVIEAVRRAYRAGGLDVDGTTPPPAPLPRELPGGGLVKPAELVDPAMQAMWNELRWLLLEEPASDDCPRRVAQLLPEVILAALPALVPKFVGATVVEMLVALAQHEAGRTRTVIDTGAWIEQARALGVAVFVEEEPPRVLAFMSGIPSGFEWPAPELDERADLRELYRQVVDGFGRPRTSGWPSPFSAPVPASFQLAAGDRYPPVPTLGHLLAAATADRRYLELVTAFHEFVPLIVLALTQLPAAALPHPAFPRRADVPEIRAMCEQAARWLAKALPSRLLAGHPAEQAIHTLVVRLLGGTTRRELTMAR